MKIFLVRDKEKGCYCARGWRGNCGKPEIYFTAKAARVAMGHKPPFAKFYENKAEHLAALFARYEIVECDVAEVGVVEV